MAKRPVALAALLAAALAVAVAGCGSSTTAKKGGTLTVLSLADVDSLDPGYAYYQYDYMAVTMPTQRTLYGWPANATSPVPDLASGMPRVTNGGKTITIKIKSGIRYSPPVNRAVTSADVKYAMERLFLPQVANGYAPVYFGAIQGVDAFTSGKAKGISGIQTPDNSTLVLQLTRPVGVIANGEALTLPGTAPVPKEYAAKFDKGKQSSYGMHLVATGPYMIPNDKAGNVTGYQPNKQIVLVRNPNWSKSTDFRPALLDKVVFLGGNDPTVASRKVLSGSAMITGDFAAPPTSVLKEAVSTRKSQVAISPSGGIRYVGLNTKVKPLDNINVRKAISAAINRTDLRLTRGGPTLGTIANHLIPPGIPGFDEAGGTAGPGYDFLANPDGNLALAQSYMKKAGYASGKYTGPPLLMVGDNKAPASNTGEAVQSQLAQIGIRTNYQQVPHPTMLSKFCQVPKAAVALCPNLGWEKDFYDAQSMIDPLFNGKNIVPTGNNNTAQLNDPKLNLAMDTAEQTTDNAKRAQQWAALDKEITGLAIEVPWIWDNDIDLRSSDVKGVINKANSAWDVDFIGLTK